MPRGRRDQDRRRLHQPAAAVGLTVTAATDAATAVGVAVAAATDAAAAPSAEAAAASAVTAASVAVAAAAISTTATAAEAISQTHTGSRAAADASRYSAATTGEVPVLRLRGQGQVPGSGLRVDQGDQEVHRPSRGAAALLAAPVAAVIRLLP